MVAAGYCLYGSSCAMVISIGEKPSVFTLDPSLGEFVLTNAQVTVPPRGGIYSVNEGNAALWDEPTSS
jgi:fructose-1,6-bisphosphatase I